MFGAQPILIVEDETLIAMCLADAVAELGGKVIGPVSTVREALEILDTQAVAAAILDSRLRDRDITPIALRLAGAGIPLVVHTGTGLPPEVAEKWPDLPVIMKPAASLTVVGRLLVEFQGLGRSDEHGLADDCLLSQPAV
jgi:DNA-binding NtrC family response regulator